MRVVIFFITFGVSVNIFAQEDAKEKKFGIEFSGFIKSDYFFDTRSVVAAREGHFLFFPAPEDRDDNGVDLNAKSSFNFLAIHSRLRGSVTGPTAFGAETSGVLEADFFGQTDADINLFRLRHAFIQFDWGKTVVLAGQFWNPLFATGCYPGTVSFNTGTPFQSFARNPQLRLTQNLSPNVRLVVAAVGQRDLASRGPNGMSSIYLRQSSVPDMHGQLLYDTKNEQTGVSWHAGIGASYKKIVPRTSSTVNNVTHQVKETACSMALIGFAKLTMKPVTVKVQARYAENMADVLSLGGYAMKQVTDSRTGSCTWTPLTNTTVWGDIQTNGEKIQVGVFVGYEKNNGSKQTIDPSQMVFGFGQDIHSLVRVSPRIVFISNKVQVGIESEYTAAAYGNDFNNDWIPASTTDVANLRLLLSVGFFF